MKKNLLLISLLVLISAVSTSCSSDNNNPNTTSPESSAITEPTPTPIDPLSIKKPQSDISIVVNRGNVLGTFDLKSNKWVNAPDSQKLLKGDEVFTYYSYDSVVGTGINPKIKDGKSIDIAQDFPYSNNDELNAKVFIYQLGISGPWNALPRVPKSSGANLITYGKIVKDVLDKNKLSDSNISIKKSAEVDLDGDGTVEKLVCAYDYNTANWFKSEGAEGQGTYSMVVLNKIVDGQEQNIVIREQYSKSKPKKECIYFAPMVLDIDNDNNMEIIVEGKNLNTSTIEVFKVVGKDVKKVYSTEIVTKINSKK
jgi:hypothetical protein